MVRLSFGIVVWVSVRLFWLLMWWSGLVLFVDVCCVCCLVGDVVVVYGVVVWGVFGY